MIRIVLVDDHPIVRRGLRELIAEQGHIRIVGEAGDWAGLRQLLRDVEADVLVLDISLPGKSGIDILQSLAGEYPDLKVLVLSMYPEDQYGLRALRAGACGYLNKATATEDLVRAIETVASGRKYVSPALAQSLLENLTGAAADRPHERLSNREFQVLCLIAKGRRLADIAAELTLSPKTVSVYRARILEKMGLANNAELTHYAFRHQLVD